MGILLHREDQIFNTLWCQVTKAPKVTWAETEMFTLPPQDSWRTENTLLLERLSGWWEHRRCLCSTKSLYLSQSYVMTIDGSSWGSSITGEGGSYCSTGKKKRRNLSEKPSHPRVYKTVQCFKNQGIITNLLQGNFEAQKTSLPSIP